MFIAVTWLVQDFEDFKLALVQKWFLITDPDCAEVTQSCVSNSIIREVIFT